MPLTLLRKLIISVLIALILIGSLVGLVFWEAKLLETRGYGHIGRLSVPPHFLAFLTLNRIKDFCGKEFQEFYKKAGGRLDYKRPDAKMIATNVPEVTLVENQPYAKFGIYILKSKKTDQPFLYSPNNLIAASKLTRMENKFRLSTGGEGEFFHPRGADLVVVCVMARGESPPGVYHAYPDYPLRLKEIIGFEEWKKWYFIVKDRWSHYVQSDIPPVPGCLAYTDLMQPESSKFYFPEEILAIFKAIYPNADIPEEQILREGRDY